MTNIVVIGAGVSGITSAYLLSKQKGNVITVVAKHMPGDYDIEYASPWAGANVLPMSHEKDSRWERRTWPEIKRLATEVPEAGIHLQQTILYRREKDLEEIRKGGYNFDGLFAEDPWYKTLFDNYRELGPSELPAGVASGCEFGSACINVMLYLPWLVGQCRANGVVFRRGRVGHVAEGAGLHHTGAAADVVVNATGLLASQLGGVRDAAVVPVRGQVVVVRNEAPHMAAVSSAGDAAAEADGEVTYVMTRAAGGGTVLGGTYQRGRWESQPDPNCAARILRRAVALVPGLVPPGAGPEALDIVRHGVGLRPYRDGGARVERENVAGVWVVHNYGHGGWGYQASYGCAEDVVALVGEIAALA
ncbi:FAD dependent oxidoreductase [Durotheca rogersii]|uniref:FAD dependent oxidoreductase n=1 Tax=Durotheca rogersii TaxID=419775 RepID=UPI00221FCF99|nr:FAD dependent oxidoreductase [Durotheca rogersii]KAI5868292.1 FAD dependent oxidoreductase [Durotheca rogersii]